MLLVMVQCCGLCWCLHQFGPFQVCEAVVEICGTMVWGAGARATASGCMVSCVVHAMH